MKTIILDTNSLMTIGQFKIDIFLELEKICDFKYKIKVLDGIIKELNKIIREQKGKYQLRAKLALDIIKKKKIKKIKTENEIKPAPSRQKELPVDDLLVALAKKGVIIVTQDKELRKRIKEVGGKVLIIRQRKRLVWG